MPTSQPLAGASDPRVEGRAGAAQRCPWPWVLCLVGLDYFSTLGYQPSIAFESAGRLAPLATAVVVLVTLGCLLPVYAYVAGRSPHGDGSIGLFERLVPGWRGKVLVVILLGFAATDFIFTRTLSAADAAVHLLHNPSRHWQAGLDALTRGGREARSLVSSPLWQRVIDHWDTQMVATCVLLVLGFAFWSVFRHGFRRSVVRLAVVVVTAYLALTALVLAGSLSYLAGHPDLVSAWWRHVTAGDWGVDAPAWAAQSGWAVAAFCVLLFPKMALGLSGFEMSMAAMPLLPGDGDEDRVRNVRKVLAGAALIMSAYLLASALVTAVLLPPAALGPGGPAANRALAYLAHGGVLADGRRLADAVPLFGEAFGTLYDVSTIVILSLAGASVAIILRDFVPPYLHRLGMELDWAHNVGAIIYLFNLIKLAVTFFFQASVTAQRGAYATSMLVMIVSACLAGALDRSRRRLPAWPFAAAGVGFVITLAAVVVARPLGFQITLWFIAAIIITSMVSRALRTIELRFHGFAFADESSRFLWESMKYLEFPILVPHRPGRRRLADKEEHIRRRHRLPPEAPVVFVEAEMGDASEFHQLPLVHVTQEEGRFVVRITRCASVPHALAAAALELSQSGKPPEIHFGWSDETPLAANVNFVLFGQGNVPWMVRELIRKAEPHPDRQPRVIIG